MTATAEVSAIGQIEPNSSNRDDGVVLDDADGGEVRQDERRHGGRHDRRTDFARVSQLISPERRRKYQSQRLTNCSGRPAGENYLNLPGAIRRPEMEKSTPWASGSSRL